MKKFTKNFLFLFGCLTSAFFISNKLNAQTYTIGTGTTSNTTTSYPAPYGNYYGSAKHQILFTAAELNAAGMTGPCKITSLAFSVKTANGTALNGFTIGIKQTATAALAATSASWQTGFTTVNGPSDYVDATGWNTHTFSAPFCWDGTSNILIQTCFFNPSFSNNALIYNSNAGFNATHWLSVDGADQCPLTTAGSVSTTRPNIRFTTAPSTPDIAATALITPIGIINSGSSNTVSFTFQNQSCAGTFTTANVGYKWNNNAPVTAAWTGSLAVGASTTYNFATPLTGAPSGLNTLKVWVNNPNGITPDANTINDTITAQIFVDAPVSAPPIVLSALDYWFTFPMNSSASSYQLVINSSYCASGTVNFPLLGNYTKSFSVVPGTTLTLTIPTNPVAGQPVYNTANEVIQNKGFHVTSDSLISVSVVPYESASVDGDFILPTSMLGQSYVLTSRAHDSPTGTAFTVGAVQNNTTINICNRVTGACNTIILNAGETYRVSSTVTNVNNSNTEDNVTNYNVSCTQLTTSRVVSDKPIYVLGHADCSNMGYCGACDVLMAQAIPLNLQGTKHVVAQPIKRNAANGVTCLPGSFPLPTIPSMADFVEIVGPVGTAVHIERQAGMAGGSTVDVLIPNNGPFGYGYYWYYNPVGTGSENVGEANMIITTSNPVQVVQYGQGWQTDNQNFTDAEMITIFPETFWKSEYLFSTSSSVASTNNVVIVVDNTNTGAGAPISTFKIDGAAVPAVGWQSIGIGNYKFIRRAVSLGTAAHAIQNTAGYTFDIYATAVGAAESYTIQLGANPIRYPFAPCNIPLAINELKTFKGFQDGENNKLTWTATYNSNNNYFSIEKSKDLTTFTEIGKKVAEKEAIAKLGNDYSYLFYDFSPYNEGSYYRLKLVDNNGSSQYSDIIYLEKNLQFEVKNAYFDKENQRISITYTSPENYNSTINLYDVSGRIISKLQATFEKGSQSLYIPVENVTPGIYFLNMNNSNSKTFNFKIPVY